jgi:hypothetical protein
MVAALILTVHIAGCPGTPVHEPPKTYPVQGTVKNKDGTPVTRGFIEFRSEKESVVANGMIQPDGSFKLKTAFENVHLNGAVAGKHQVTYHPFQEQDQTKAPFQAPVILAERFTVEPIEQNSIDIRLE